MSRPQFFLSAVSGEFLRQRAAIAQVLGARGVDVVSMEQKPTGHGDLTDELKALIDRCDGLIQLVGARYGTPARGSAAAGMSCTEFEYRYARRRGIRTYVFVAAGPDGGQTAGPAAEDIGRQRAQRRYREELLASDQICGGFASDDELLRQVHEIFNELPQLREREQLAQRRTRRSGRLLLAIAAAIALLLFAGYDKILQSGCALPLLRSGCSAQGWGNLPTPAQQQLFAAHADCGCAGLKRYIGRADAHPALLAAAQRALATQRSETEPVWVATRTLQYRHRIGLDEAEPRSDEAQARGSSIARLQRQAGMLCEAYDAAADVRIVAGSPAAVLDALDTRCETRGQRVYCSAEATLYCDVEVRRLQEKTLCTLDGRVAGGVCALAAD